MQTKELEGGHKLTFMKFTFQSPALEIKAPVLNDKTVGYQVGIFLTKHVEQYKNNPSAGAPTERCLCFPKSHLQYSSRWTWRARGASGKYREKLFLLLTFRLFRALATLATLSPRHGQVVMLLLTQEGHLDGRLDLPSTNRAPTPPQPCLP